MQKKHMKKCIVYTVLIIAGSQYTLFSNRCILLVFYVILDQYWDMLDTD